MILLSRGEFFRSVAISASQLCSIVLLEMLFANIPKLADGLAATNWLCKDTARRTQLHAQWMGTDFIVSLVGDESD